MKKVSGVGMGVEGGGAGNRRDAVVSSGGVGVAGGELHGGIVAGSLRFSESSGKTFHTVSHSCSMSEISFCRLAWKENVVKVVKVLTEQHVGRSVEKVKA